MNQLPEFILMGAMKCATSTLHEQLDAQEGFFMTEDKEPNFFSNDEIYAKGLDWYQSLFAGAAPGDLRGESSTHYTKLPTYPRTVERMKAALPELKLIYMMRHPIDRLVSHYMHEQFEWRMRMPIEEAVNTYPELVSYGCYGRQLEPFLEAYGAENILLIFFERFIREGPSELSRVCRFLGSASEPRWVDSLSLTNVSNERMRDSPLRDRIVNAPVLRTIRRRLIPRSWRNRVKRFWQIRERPRLSPATIHRLEDAFDADLATLGGWLNLDLSCRRFREVARSTVPEWTGKANPLGERILANSTSTSSCVPSSHE